MIEQKPPCFPGNPESSVMLPKIVLFLCRVSVLLMISTTALSIHAQNYTPVKNIAEFKSLYAVKSASINTLTSDFSQEKSISMLEHKIKSQGSFIFKKSDKLLMKYTKPYTYLFAMDHDKITVKNDLGKSSVAVNSNQLYKMISQITIDCVTGNVLNQKEFDIKVSENTLVYHLSLIPRQKLLKSLFTEIELLISKNDFTVDKLEMKESSGDYTVLVFSNKKLNSPVADDVFTVK